MTATYDTATPTGQVRLLCRDTNTANALFSDAEIGVFLAVCSNAVLLAAAMALENIAANETLVQKRIQLLDLKTDGPAESAELRALAKSMREQYERMGETFEVAELVVDSFNWREHVLNDAKRGLV